MERERRDVSVNRMEVNLKSRFPIRPMLPYHAQMRASGSRDAVQMTPPRTPQLPLLDVRSAPNSRGPNAYSRSRTRHRLKLGGSTCEIVALVGVVFLAIVVLVLDVFLVLLLLLFPVIVLTIVEQLGASHGCIALELSQPENVDATLLAFVAGAEQEYTVLLDHVQLLDLHRLVEEHPVRNPVCKGNRQIDWN